MRGARITQARLLVLVRKVLKETGKCAKVMTIDIEYVGSVYEQVGNPSTTEAYPSTGVTLAISVL